MIRNKNDDDKTTEQLHDSTSNAMVLAHKFQERSIQIVRGGRIELHSNIVIISDCPVHPCYIVSVTNNRYSDFQIDGLLRLCLAMRNTSKIKMLHKITRGE